MTMTRIDGLAFEVQGDYIELEQDIGSGDVARVWVHRIHLEHLARECGLLAPDVEAQRIVALLQRRLLTLASEVKSLADWVRSAPDGDEARFPDFLMTMALERLALALVDDIPGGERPAPACATKLVDAGNQIDCSTDGGHTVSADGRNPSASDADRARAAAPVAPACDGQLDLLEAPR